MSRTAPRGNDVGDPVGLPMSEALREGGAEEARSGEGVAIGDAGWRRHLPILFLLIVAAWLFGYGIGSYPLWDPWEPKYADAVAEMRERGDMITPYLDGRIRWTKPILIYWLIWPSVVLFGDTEFAVRLPSVIAALFGLWALYYTLRRLRGPTVAFAGAAILMTLPQYYYLARQAMPDMVLTAFLSAAMGFLALARFSASRREGHLIAFWSCLAVAFLTKGPVACVIAGWALVIFLLPELDPAWIFSPRECWRRLRHLAGSYRLGRGILLFALIAGPWYGAILAIHGWGFIDNFVLDENLQRFSEPLFGHDGITSRYMTTLIHGSYPWTGLLLVALIGLMRGRDLDDEFRQRWFFASWLISGFTLVTVAGTKLDHYLLPVMPAVAVLIALLFEAWYEPRRPAWIRPALLLSVALTALPLRDFIFEGNRFIMSVFVPAQDMRILDVVVERVLWAGFAVWVVAIAWAWIRPGSRWAAGLTLVVALTQASFFSHVALPADSPDRSLRSYAERFSENAGPQTRLIYYGWIRHSIAHYHDGDFRYFEPGQLEELLEYLQESDDVLILVQELFFDDLLDELHRGTRSRWTTVGDSNPYFLLIARAPDAPTAIP